MNIISNNCLGGFIYRDILKTEYKNPFIWSSFDPDNFIEFIDNYETINFDNYELFKLGPGMNHNFKLKIDDKYILNNDHMWFDANAKTPTVFQINNCDIKYCKIWEYIVNNYEKRLKRMKNEIKTVFIFYDHEKVCKSAYKLTDIFKRHKNYKGIAFTYQDIPIKQTDNLIILPVKEEWNKPPAGWYPDFMYHYKNKLSELLKNI